MSTSRLLNSLQCDAVRRSTTTAPEGTSLSHCAVAYQTTRSASWFVMGVVFSKGRMDFTHWLTDAG